MSQAKINLTFKTFERFCNKFNTHYAVSRLGGLDCPVRYLAAEKLAHDIAEACETMIDLLSVVDSSQARRWAAIRQSWMEKQVYCNKLAKLSAWKKQNKKHQTIFSPRLENA